LLKSRVHYSISQFLNIFRIQIFDLYAEGSVSLLRLGIDSSDMQLMNDAWNVLAANHQQLSGLLLDLLSLTRDEPLQLENCNLSELVIEATEAVQSTAQEDQITLQLDDDLRQAPVYAAVDARAMHRADGPEEKR